MYDAVTGILGTNFPTGLSGTPLSNLINQRVVMVEQALGVTIGTTAIPEKYQGVITKFLVSDCLDMGNPANLDKSIGIGELSMSKSPVVNGVGNVWFDRATKELNELKGRYNYKKAFG